MIRNEAKLIGRLTADPELKYTKNSNTPVCNVVLAVNNISVTGYLKTRSYIDSNNSVRNIVEIIVDEVDYLGFTKKGIDKSENIPDLDPNHKSQEEYQMIHNALSESEDLPF